MTPTPERPRGRGRPRDPVLDGRILAAARQVVVDGGVCSASMTAIAERAGVGKPTVYLRWGNVVEVVTAAFEEMAWTEEVGARFRAAVAAIDALAEVPDGPFLAEVAALSAQDRLGWSSHPHRRLRGPA